MPRHKPPSKGVQIEAPLEDYVPQGESQPTESAPITSASAALSETGISRQLDGPKNIIEVVEADPHLWGIIQAMLESRFLLPGPFGFLRDTDRIESAWKRSKSQANALAMGIHLDNEFFCEGVNSIILKGDFIVSRETKGRRALWESQVKKLFPKESSGIIQASFKIGQYLEFRNRKSQGF